MAMIDSTASEVRHQIERWIEESHLLLGRIIPSVLDDNQRLRDKLTTSEQESDRMREEVAVLRREVVGLQTELEALRGQHEYLKGEQSAVADSLTRTLHHLTQMVQPINEMVAKLHVAQTPGLEGALR
jgi:chromosome segregation ATPase